MNKPTAVTQLIIDQLEKTNKTQTKRTTFIYELVSLKENDDGSLDGSRRIIYTAGHFYLQIYAKGMWGAGGQKMIDDIVDLDI
jgi:hypothetical protein